MSENYYQLATPIGKLASILPVLSAQKIQSAQLKEDDSPLLAIKVTTENLLDFDKKMSSLNIKYFLIKNLNFKLLLRNTEKLNIRIRNINVGDLESPLKEEYEDVYDKALSSRNYQPLVDIIEKNELIIKKLEISHSGHILTIYENGMVWISEDLLASDETKNLLKRVISIFK